MITLIVGEINSGKTRMIQDIYNHSHQGDGFACIKVFENNIHTKFNFLRLSNNEQIPFMVNEKYYDQSTYYNETFKSYRYSRQALEQVKEVVLDLINHHVSPIYLDEIGLLELEGKGHHETLLHLLNSKLDIVLAIRDKFVDKVIQHYHLKDYQIKGVRNE